MLKRQKSSSTWLPFEDTPLTFNLYRSHHITCIIPTQLFNLKLLYVQYIDLLFPPPPNPVPLLISLLT